MENTRIYAGHVDDPQACRALLLLQEFGAQIVWLTVPDPLIMTGESFVATGRRYPGEDEPLPDEPVWKLSDKEREDRRYFIPPYADRARELILLQPIEHSPDTAALSRALHQLHLSAT